MQPGPHPDAINVRLVFRMYAWITISSGVFIYVWPQRWLFGEWLSEMDLPGLPFGRYAVLRTAMAVIVAMGLSAAGFSRIEDPVSQRRALNWYAGAHLFAGGMFFIQWHAIYSIVLPSPILGWTPLIVGAVLLFISLTAAHAPRLPRPFRGPFGREPLRGPVLVARTSDMSIATLRSQYEQHIRQAARLEERARLARDLHDAVKQQLFAIQTAAATAQERFSTDEGGARSALDHVRAAARDAMTEMQAMIEQLQAAPVENDGLLAALQQQCEALGLRTGVKVSLDAPALPASDRLPPGAPLALFRAVQEALANIARHARAQHVVVHLNTSPDSVDVWIRDDGVGFDPAAAMSGMGMNNMRTRLAEVGGSLLMQSAPGRGTLVAFSVPCDTRTSGDYARRAITWIGASIALGAVLTRTGTWEHPWYFIVVAVTAVTAARFTAAWYRVRQSPSTSIGVNMAMMIGAAHWYSWDFNVTEGERHLARVDVSGWREKGILTIDGMAYRVYREGVMHGDFLLERDGIVLARATKPSAFRNRLVIRHDGRTYELAKASLWRRRYVVRSGNAEIGSLSPTSAWRREAAVKLPEQWPLPLKVFVIWLVVILWNRESSAMGSA